MGQESSVIKLSASSIYATEEENAKGRGPGDFGITPGEMGV
jgi:hypothetical protein